MREPTIIVRERSIIGVLHLWRDANNASAITLTRATVIQLLDEIQEAMTEEYHAGIERR